MKRPAILGAVAPALAVMLALTACSSGGGAASAESSSDPADVSGTIRVLIPAYPASNEGKAAFQEVVDDFQGTYPNVKVEPDFATYANLNEKISTSIASGSGYDVLVTGVGWIQPFAAKNVFEDLAEHGVTKDKLAEETTSALTAAVTYQDKIYGWPLTADARAIGFRKSAFIEAGLDPENPPTSFDEIKAAAEKLTKRDAAGSITRPGFDFNAPAGSYRQAFVQLLAANGKPLYVDGKPNFDNKEAVETLDWMKSMINNVQPFGQQNAAQKPMTYTGEAAMGFVGGSVDCSDAGIGQANCDDLGYFLLDNGEEIEMVGGNLASVGANSKLKDAAWGFIEALSSDEALEGQARLNNQIPATADTEESEVVKSNGLSQFVAANLDKAIYEGGASNWLEVRNNFNSSIDDVLLGKRDAADVLGELAAQSR
jgi:multiple sugar transport system substrate-binding protein